MPKTERRNVKLLGTAIIVMILTITGIMWHLLKTFGKAKKKKKTTYTEDLQRDIIYRNTPQMKCLLPLPLLLNFV